MHSKWVFKHFRGYSNRGFCSFATLWTLSLLIGFLLCAQSSLDPVLAVKSFLIESPGAFTCFVVRVLPVAVIAIALLTPFFAISCFPIFLWGVSHGYCGYMFCIAAGNAAWLLRLLLLFSSGCTSVVMWWLVLQKGTGRCLHKNIPFAGVLSCVIFLIDFFVVSPIIGDLSKYF